MSAAVPRGAEGLSTHAEGQRRGGVEVEPGNAPQEVSAVGIISVLLRHRLMIILLSLLFGFVAGFQSITAPRLYTVKASFMPKGARGSSQLGGIAAQFGVNLSSGDPTQSPQLYTDLLETRALLWPVAQRQYTIHTDSGVRTGNIVQLFNIKHPRPEVVRVKAVERLQGAIKGTLTPKTGLINLTVSTFNPELSYQITQNVLDQVNIYNLANKQKDAAATRAFVEGQVNEKLAQLRQAEDEEATFLERNRQYRMSPELTLAYQRLVSAVTMRQQLYTSLLNSYETARIEEVRDLPVITVIEPPEMPIEPDRRGGVKKTITGLLAGFLLGCLIAFPRDKMARKREAQTDDFLEYAALKREALADLTHPWRPVTRAFQSRPKA